MFPHDIASVSLQLAYNIKRMHQLKMNHMSNAVLQNFVPTACQHRYGLSVITYPHFAVLHTKLYPGVNFSNLDTIDFLKVISNIKFRHS